MSPPTPAADPGGRGGASGPRPPPLPIVSLIKLVIKRWPPSAVTYISCFLAPPPDNPGSDAASFPLSSLPCICCLRNRFAKSCFSCKKSFPPSDFQRVRGLLFTIFRMCNFCKVKSCYRLFMHQLQTKNKITIRKRNVSSAVKGASPMEYCMGSVK